MHFTSLFVTVSLAILPVVFCQPDWLSRMNDVVTCSEINQADTSLQWYRENDLHFTGKNNDSYIEADLTNTYHHASYYFKASAYENKVEINANSMYGDGRQFKINYVKADNTFLKSFWSERNTKCKVTYGTKDFLRKDVVKITVQERKYK
jgi:hypothetical protein